MLGFEQFSYKLIEKYTVIMGSILANIRIERATADGSLAIIEVPTALATKEKMLARLQADPNIDRPYSVLLPRISWEQVDIQYDPDRKLNTTNRRVIKIPGEPNKLKYVPNPVPYNFFFKAVVYGKNQSDVNNIVEQILPHFTPDWTVTAELVPEMGITHDIPTTLNATQIEDIYSEDFKDRRVYTWDLQFCMKGYLYGPLRTKPIIKFADTNLLVWGSTDPVISMRVQPGLTANGDPTSNAAASVAVATIQVDDNYGYVTIVTENGT